MQYLCEQNRICIVMNTDYDVLYGHFNCMEIVKVRLLHLRCRMLFRKWIRNDVYENHIPFGKRLHMATVIRRRDLIRCHFSAMVDPVKKGIYRNVVFKTPVSICHAALAAFINKPDLPRHGNTSSPGSCHNLSS